MRNSVPSIQSLSAILALSFLFTACGSGKSGNSDAYQSGSNLCSQEFVSDTNALAQIRVYTNDLNSMNEAERQINSYESKYRDVECKALVNGSETMVNVNGTVASARQKLQGYRDQYNSNHRVERRPDPTPAPTATPIPVATPAAPVVVAPAPVTNDTPVAQPSAPIKMIDGNPPVSEGLKLIIKDSIIFNRLAAAGVNQVIQSGGVVSLDGLTNRTKNLCYLEYSSGVKPLASGEQVAIASSQIKDQSQKLLIVSEKFMIGCLRLDGRNESWHVSNLQEVFGGIANISGK